MKKNVAHLRAVRLKVIYHRPQQHEEDEEVEATKSSKINALQMPNSQPKGLIESRK